MISNALSPNARERATAYALGYKNTQTASQALPQRIAIFTPIADTKVSGMSFDTPQSVLSMSDFYSKFGVCPGFYADRILQPQAGGGVQTPVDVYPIEDTGAVAVGDITPTGTATANATHTIIFNGRSSIDGKKAVISIETGDTSTAIIAKIIAVVNAHIFAPVIATDGTTKATLTSKWKGTTANQIKVTIDTGTEDAGITYAITQPTGATSTNSITTALANLGDVWTTFILDAVETQTALNDFETANGLPDVQTGGTGRWKGTIMKPFIAVHGSTDKSTTNLKAISASRENDLTNMLAIAPGSNGYSFEAGANLVTLAGSTFNVAPHRTINGKSYPDMPKPDAISEVLNDYDVRNDLVTNGISTVTYTPSSGYVVETAIVFRRPTDQNPLAIDWSYIRDIILDMNVAYNYKIKEGEYLRDKTIANDNDVVTAEGVVKPKDWKAIIFELFEELGKKALITDLDYSKKSVVVKIADTDPQRINTVFYYKRTGIARKTSTTAYTGFNFGA